MPRQHQRPRLAGTATSGTFQLAGLARFSAPIVPLVFSVCHRGVIMTSCDQTRPSATFAPTGFHSAKKIRLVHPQDWCPKEELAAPLRHRDEEDSHSCRRQWDSQNREYGEGHGGVSPEQTGELGQRERRATLSLVLVPRLVGVDRSCDLRDRGTLCNHLDVVGICSRQRWRQ